MESLTELWKRDKNRPSVIMWSVANEPETSSNNAKKHAKAYFELVPTSKIKNIFFHFFFFRKVVKHIRSLDNGRRPITLANPHSFNNDYSESVNFLSTTPY